RGGRPERRSHGRAPASGHRPAEGNGATRRGRRDDGRRLIVRGGAGSATSATSASSAYHGPGTPGRPFRPGRFADAERRHVAVLVRDRRGVPRAEDDGGAGLGAARTAHVARNHRPGEQTRVSARSASRGGPTLTLARLP